MAGGQVASLPGEDAWLTALRRYFAVIVPGHLGWEVAQLPLYTIWREGTPGEIAFAVLHCTGGDILIALASLMGALLLLGRGWPMEPAAFRKVAVLAIAAGVGYTIFSEWLNTELRGAWTYTAQMPVLPVTGTGLAPLLQWVVIPSVGLWWAGRFQTVDRVEPRHA